MTTNLFDAAVNVVGAENARLVAAVAAGEKGHSVLLLQASSGAERGSPAPLRAVADIATWRRV